LSGSHEYVGFWPRLAALAIDVLVLFVVVAPPVLAIYGREHIARSVAGYLAFALHAAAVIVFWRYCGATPGKIAVSAKIVDARSGGRPSTGRLVARYFAYIASGLPLFLGFVWIAIDRRKQGWHDKIAGTVVVYDDD